MGSKSPFRTGLLSGLVLAFTLMAWSCGGGGGSSPKGERFDPSHATDLVTALLVTADDLPSSPWQLGGESVRLPTSSSTSNSSAFDATLSSEPSCAGLQQQASVLSGESSSALAHAERSFSAKRSGVLFPLSVQQQAEIYDSASNLEHQFEAARKAFDSTGQECLGKIFSSQITRGLSQFNSTVEVQPVSPGASAPRNGLSLGYRFTISIPGAVNLSGLFDLYIFSYGNALTTLAVFGSPEDVKPETTGAIVKAIDARMVKAASEARDGKIPTSSIPTTAAPAAFQGKVSVSLTDQVPDSGQYVIQNTFNPNVKQIIAVVQIEGARPGMLVVGKWYQLRSFGGTPSANPDGSLITEAGFNVDQKSINVDGRGGGRLTLNPTAPLPEDSYQLRVYVDGKLAATAGFVVSRLAPGQR